MHIDDDQINIEIHVGHHWSASERERERKKNEKINMNKKSERGYRMWWWWRRQQQKTWRMHNQLKNKNMRKGTSIDLNRHDWWLLIAEILATKTGGNVIGEECVYRYLYSNSSLISLATISEVPFFSFSRAMNVTCSHLLVIERRTGARVRALRYVCK